MHSSKKMHLILEGVLSNKFLGSFLFLRESLPTNCDNKISKYIETNQFYIHEDNTIHAL